MYIYISHIYVYVHVFICMYVCVCVCVYIYIYIQGIYIYIYTGRDAYPWDPTLDPQIWHTAHPHCGDGKLRDACWDRLGGKDAPPIPESATMASMQATSFPKSAILATS